MKVKELFEKVENGVLTYEQFDALMKEAKANFADLSEGGYVSKHKYEDELEAKVREIETLNETIGARDKDLTSLRKQLEEAEEGYIKVQELNEAIVSLQDKYDEDMSNYKEQLSKQAYEFAVKEFANDQEFSSQAAKRDFIQSLMKAELKMDKEGNIKGIEDFAKTYKKENADAFTSKKEEQPAQDAVSTLNASRQQPQFVSPTPGTAAPKAPTLTEMMMAANNNPGISIN